MAVQWMDAMNKLLFNSLALALTLTGCATNWQPRYTAASPESLLNQVREHVPTVVLADAIEPTAFAGHYTSGSGLSGSELYLFPDGSYMYTEWADILPETLYDRGRWSLSEGILRLSSDATLSKTHLRDKSYVGMHYKGKAPLDPLGDDQGAHSGLVLMGMNWDYSMYIHILTSDLREKWTDQETYESSFLICTYKKVDDIQARDIEGKKRSLARQIWTPDLGD
jgi:hypothetical protein